jgi:large subunit ribosomal protein L25
MVRDYQLDPVTHKLLHADFYALAMDREITVSVPIIVKGEAAGVKQQGGLLDFVTREIQVQCLPTDIPERIDIDVTDLALHQSVRVKDLATSPKWKALTDGETMLVHVVMPKAEESATTTAAEGEGAAAAPAAAGAAPSEPEVIKKGKTEEKEEKK